MRTSQILILLFLALFYRSEVCFGGEIELVAPLGELKLYEPQSPPPQGGPFSYAESAPGSKWGVVQWNLPGGKLLPFQSSGSGDSVRQVANAKTARVEISKAKGRVDTIELYQNGSVAPCNNDKGEPREIDLFLQPVGGREKDPAKRGMLQLGAQNPNLESLSALMVQAKVSSSGKLANKTKGCKANMGSAVVSLFIKNESANQAMSYQLKLAPICGDAPLNPCKQRDQKLHWYFTKNPFGTDDFLSSLGQAFIGSNMTELKVDILPRLKEALSTGPAGLNSELSKWVVSGVYIGQHIWGDVELTTRWSSYRLTAVTK